MTCKLFSNKLMQNIIYAKSSNILNPHAIQYRVALIIAALSNGCIRIVVLVKYIKGTLMQKKMVNSFKVSHPFLPLSYYCVGFQ